MTREGWGSL